MSNAELIARLRESQSYEWQDPIWETRLAAADRIEALEAKLAKAVEVLVFYATQDVIYPHVGKVTFTGYDDDGRLARATLAEIKGESHD
jgi:hypothetical protein